MDKVNVGILKPINPVSNSENHRRTQFCIAQRNRADLKRLHYDGARMYHDKLNPIVLLYFLKFDFQSMKFMKIGYQVNISQRIYA